jgi:tRNA-2-methylthio-N6-dimethylallyladenosine synthase
METQVPDEVKSERLKRFQDLICGQQLQFNTQCVGTVMPVLFDGKGKREGQIAGKSQYMQSVLVAGAGEELIGRIADVKITFAGQNSLRGELV